MEIIFILGSKLAQLLKINEAQAIGVITLAIKDGNKKMNALSYDDCREVIQTYLKARLAKMNTANIDAVIKDMLKVLSEKQSLFVMMAR